MPVHAYLAFNGDCRQAVEYYAEVFRLPVPEVMTFGQVPPDDGSTVPPEMKDLAMHTRLNVHGTALMFSDAMPNTPIAFGKNITLAVVSDDLQREFALFSEEGRVIMPLEKTFFSPAYGIVEDKFGVEWQFNYNDGSMQ